MKSIITIGRQTGSGGRYIGKKIAEKLNIPFYDSNLLQRAAKECGFCKEIFETHDEKPTNSFLYSLVMSNSFTYGPGGFSDMPLDHKVFMAQFNTIRSIADEGPCVIVGRCADYALEGYAPYFSVFIHAPEDDRVETMRKRFSELTLAKAHDQINKTDKQRKSYYNYYTNKNWGSSLSYDMCLDSSSLTMDACVDIIIKAAEIKDSVHQ